MERHWQLAESLYGPDRTPTLMRKFGIKYSASHPQQLEVRPRFAQIRSQSDWYRVLEDWYREDLPGVYPPVSEHSSQSEGCQV
jgi:tRNA-dihydrouridine synthase B